MSEPWPLELRLSRAEGVLRIRFDDGCDVALTAPQLRAATPSAAEHGHGPRKRLDPAAFSGVAIADLKPIGRYAVQIVFTDGHDTGFYTWPALYKLGAEAASAQA